MRRLAATAVALLGLSTPGFAQNQNITQFGLSWLLSGNRPTSSSAFLGTLNDRPLVLKSRGREALRILPNGDVGIGTTTPGAPLEVENSADIADAAKFVLSSRLLNGTQAAVDAVNSGGSASKVGYYGSAGAFNITNPMNTAPAVYAATVTPGGAAIYGTESVGGGGMGVFGDEESNQCCAGSAGVYGFSAINSGVRGVSGAVSSWAMGRGANFGVWGDSHDGTGVWGSSDTGDSALFAGGASGKGVCNYAGGSGWNCSSDRALKTDFAPVDTAALLDRLARMPVFTYRFKQSRDGSRFLGPMAQDFAAAFHLGTGDDRYINTANAEGVALAAAKALYERVKRDDTEIAADRARIAALEARLARLEQIAARTVAGRPQQQPTLATR
jgi:hypothetical protein